MQSMGYALKGIKHFLKYEHNAWIQAVIAFCTIALGFYLGLSHIEWVVICIAIGLVFTAEIFNTAIELLVDFVSPDYHEKAGKIKDLAAGGVLICAFTALLVGLIILVPKMGRLF
jgi:diacylglycerol kinase (ATP)